MLLHWTPSLTLAQQDDLRHRLETQQEVMAHILDMKTERDFYFDKLLHVEVARSALSPPMGCRRHACDAENRCRPPAKPFHAPRSQTAWRPC